MSFQSLSFLVFLAAAVVLCRAAGRWSRLLGLGLLEMACLAFYTASGGWRALALLALGGGVSYLAARRPSRSALFAAAGYHIAVLLGCKLLGWMPLGISFFTFQQLWLLHETASGAFRLTDRAAFPLYVFFFPTVTSGPILKPQGFFGQLAGDRFLRPAAEDLAAGLYAVFYGTAKKVLLADGFGAVVDNGWARLGSLSAVDAWLVILGYTLQLYFDFSGYCDIAAGCARLLGIRLPVNFNSPYRALSVGEFWKRWHMTLTSFLRECLYFPLGGSRKGTARTCANIMLVFLVSGFWHGAGWTFLLWGGLHGAAQVLERLWGKRRERLPRLLRWCLTFAFVNVAWVFFRAGSVSSAVTLLKTAVIGPLASPPAWLFHGLLPSETKALRLLLPDHQSLVDLGRGALLYAAGLTAALWPRNVIAQMDAFRPTRLGAAALGLVMAWCVLSFTGMTTFIYSNF